MRATQEEYEEIDLRAHSLLGEVPLHDVWVTELPGGGPSRTMVDLRPLLASESATRSNAAVRLLFGLRTLLGRVFDWDREPPGASRESFLHRLSDEDRKDSLVPPGELEGPRMLHDAAEARAA